ncbi:MAG: hypothetical protein RL693_1157 [Verrucomicrobiota bacterium]
MELNLASFKPAHSSQAHPQNMIFPRRNSSLSPARPGVNITSVFGLVCIVALLTGSLCADVTRKADDKKKNKDKETVSIPEARDVAARFVAGQSVDIELVAAVGSLKQPDFIIRQQPEHGTLSNLRPHLKESNKAIIAYTHAGMNEALADKFTYACRIDGGPMSAPAVVTLSGQRMEPKISLVNTPSFAKIFAGGESSSSVFLKNEGTAPYLMNIAWPEGWVGPPSIDVPIGKTVEIQIFFRPKKVGEFRFEGELQKGVPSSKLFLYGECLRPLTVSPGSISLSLDTKTGVRTGTFSLVYARPEAVQVKLKLPPRINGPADMEIPAQGKVEVSVFLAAQDVEAYNGEIEILVGTAVEKVAVQSAAKPAELQLVAPEKGVLDFGSLDQRKTVEREIILLNAGGEPMIVQVDCRLPFSVEESGKALRIEPRQQRSLKVRLKSESSGKLSQDLKIVGGLNTLTVGMLADVREVKVAVERQPTPMPSVVPSPVVTPSPVTAPANGEPSEAAEAGRSRRQLALMSFLQTEGWPLPKESINHYLERVMNVQMVEHTASSMTLEWKKPDIAPAGWILEYSSQIYDAGQGFSVKSWARFNNWKPVEGGPADKVTVKLQPLKAGAQYEFRVMGVDRDGKVSEPSPRMLFATKESWRLPSWLWRTLLAVALGLVAYVLHRVRRGDFDED